MILDVLRRGDPEGMTADDIQRQLILDGVLPGENPNYVRPRLSEMKESGLVEGVDRRLSNAKCKMTVWKVKS